MTTPRTLADWQRALGEQVRQARLDADIDQQTLADRVSISVGALRNLEQGRGARLSTVIQVARGLGQESWLGQFYAAPASPLQLARERALAPTRRRASRRSR